MPRAPADLPPEDATGPGRRRWIAVATIVAVLAGATMVVMLFRRSSTPGPVAGATPATVSSIADDAGSDARTTTVASPPSLPDDALAELRTGATPTTEARPESSAGSVAADRDVTTAERTDGPPATTVADPIDRAQLPAAAGSFGDKPAFTFPTGIEPARTLQRVVLANGSGPIVEDGAVVLVDYEGVVWGATEPFDSSYDRAEPLAVTVGAEVINGWRLGLPGVREGSRILLSIPPQGAYGGEEQPLIPANSTLGVRGGRDFLLRIRPAARSTRGPTVIQSSVTDHLRRAVHGFR